MDKDQAVEFLESLLGKSLRVHTTDTRMFVGIFKCTDAVRLPVLLSASSSLLVHHRKKSSSKIKFKWQ